MTREFKMHTRNYLTQNKAIMKNRNFFKKLTKKPNSKMAGINPTLLELQ